MAARFSLNQFSASESILGFAFSLQRIYLPSLRFSPPKQDLSPKWGVVSVPAVATIFT